MQAGRRSVKVSGAARRTSSTMYTDAYEYDDIAGLDEREALYAWAPSGYAALRSCAFSPPLFKNGLAFDCDRSGLRADPRNSQHSRRIRSGRGRPALRPGSCAWCRTGTHVLIVESLRMSWTLRPAGSRLEFAELFTPQSRRVGVRNLAAQKAVVSAMPP